MRIHATLHEFKINQQRQLTCLRSGVDNQINDVLLRYGTQPYIVFSDIASLKRETCYRWDVRRT